jgi:hypothetical protein
MPLSNAPAMSFRQTGFSKWTFLEIENLKSDTPRKIHQEKSPVVNWTVYATPPPYNYNSILPSLLPRPAFPRKPKTPCVVMQKRWEGGM